MRLSVDTVIAGSCAACGKNECEVTGLVTELECVDVGQFKYQFSWSVSSCVSLSVSSAGIYRNMSV